MPVELAVSGIVGSAFPADKKVCFYYIFMEVAGVQDLFFLTHTRTHFPHFMLPNQIGYQYIDDTSWALIKYHYDGW